MVQFLKLLLVHIFLIFIPFLNFALYLLICIVCLLLSQCNAFICISGIYTSKSFPVPIVCPQMLYLGRDYPDGFDVFRNRLQKAFRKNSSERDPKKVAQLITQAEFVIKEIEALYMLRKYRSLKRRYYD